VSDYPVETLDTMAKLTYTQIRDDTESDYIETSSTSSEYQPLSNHFDEDAFVSNIIITDQVEPSTIAKCCNVIKTIVLFPTKITVICGVIVGLWLSFCVSAVSLGAAFLDMCPGNPAVPQTMVVHGSAWIAVCIYTLLRLLWVEIRKDRLPEFKCGRCSNPEKKCYWKKEFTYAIDGLMMAFLLATFVAEMIEVTLVQTGRIPVLYYFDVDLIAWCDTCCLGYVMRVAIGQIILSNAAHTMLIVTYLHLFGVLSKVWDLVCKKDVARTKAESATLM